MCIIIQVNPAVHLPPCKKLGNLQLGISDDKSIWTGTSECGLNKYCSYYLLRLHVL